MGDESVTMTWVFGGNKKKRFWKSIAFVYNLITGSLDKTSQKKKESYCYHWVVVCGDLVSLGRQALSLGTEKTDCSEAWVHGLLPKCDQHLPASPPVSGEEDAEMAVIPVPQVLFCVWLRVFLDSGGSEHVQYAHVNVDLTSWGRQM